MSTSGFVADKSDIHYYIGGYQGPYSGIEVKTTKDSDIKGCDRRGLREPGSHRRTRRATARADVAR